MNKRNQKKVKTRLTASDLKQFNENRRIFNKAVEKAIKENKKAGISEKGLYAQ
ncbi:MAG TPA: hypothetical protein VFD91_15780 [Mariniphaga sp.]|jgi:hypothetical protein|nr:hypothetical protein [Mariniphaga sp.]